MPATTTLSDRVRGGEVTLGTFVDLGSAGVAEIAAGTGFDWVVVDLEHGAGGRAETLEALRAIDAARCEGFVRVPSPDSDAIGWALDAGAAGVVPRAETVDDVRRAVRRSRYAEGRGASPSPRAARYGRVAGYGASADEQHLLVVQIETRGALAEVAAIAEQPGVAVLFLGPGDLGRELGVTGADHPEILAAAEQIAGAAAAAGKAAGVYVHDAAHAEAYRALGYTFIASGFGSSLVGQAYDARLAELAAAAGRSRPAQ